MRIASSGVLTRCWPRSPWYQARTRTIGRPIRSASSAICRTCCGPVEGLADVLQALQEPPGSGDVYQSPLDDLAAAQPGPGALGSTLCRRVGHSAAPMASECSGIRSGCGCERARAAGSGSLHRPTRWLSAQRLFGQGLEASAITASARRNPAAAVAGSERESASWESGNLGSCRAFADSPGCQDSRFSVPRPGGDLGGRDRGRGSAGRAATWRTGNLERWESARRGAGRVDAGPPLPGVPAWGALGRRPWPPPWPGGARPLVRLRCEFALVAPGAPGSPLA